MSKKGKIILASVAGILAIGLIVGCVLLFGGKKSDVLYSETGLAYVRNPDGKTCTIVGIGTYADRELRIPAAIGKYTVTAIGENAFEDCLGITSLVVEEGVQVVCDYAFLNCKYLTKATIPASVMQFGYKVFHGTDRNIDLKTEGKLSVEHILIDPGFIPDFYEGKYTIHAGIKSVAYGAFSESELSTFVLGRPLVDGEPVEQENAYFTVKDDMLFNKDMSELLACPTLKEGGVIVPEGVVRIAPYAFANCKKVTKITLPESLKEIGTGAFENCETLAILKIPAGVEKIGKHLFTNCLYLKDLSVAEGNASFCVDNKGLYNKDKTVFYCASSHDMNNFVMVDSVTEIADGAFQGYEHLTKIKLPSGIKRIGDRVFYGCTMIAPQLPDSLQEIGDYAFKGCRFYMDIVIPEGVKRIGNHAFQDCKSTTTLKLPDSLEYLGDYAFAGCESLETLTISKNLSHIGDGALSGCLALREIHIADGNRNFKMEADTLYNGSMTRLLCVTNRDVEKYVIRDGVEVIDSGAFYNLNKISNLDIPVSVKRIGNESLPPLGLDVKIRYAGTKEQYEAIHIGTGNYVPPLSFDYVQTLKPANASEGLEYVVKQDGKAWITGIGQCTDSVVIVPSEIDGVPVYGIENLYHALQVTEVIVSEGIVAIKNGFGGCDNIKKISIPSTLTEMDGGDVLAGRPYGLEEITVAEGNPVFSSYDGALYSKDQKTLLAYPYKKTGPVKFPAGLTTIDHSAVYRCVGITEVVIPSTVRSIGISAFSNCRNLTSLTFEGGQPLTILSDAFGDCVLLTNITLPVEVKFIDARAFMQIGEMEINYAGTMAQWQAVEKHEDWDNNNYAYTVHCIDGDIVAE